MLYKLIEILISAVILIPFFVVLDKVRFHNTKKSVLYFIFAVLKVSLFSLVSIQLLQFPLWDSACPSGGAGGEVSFSSHCRDRGRLS